MPDETLRVCKVCKGEFLIEWEGDTHKVCPDCRPGLYNTTREERDIYTQTRTYYGQRLVDGFAMMNDEDKED